MTLTRRRFSWLLAAVAGLAATAGVAALHQSLQPELRVISYNIYQGRGWPKERRRAEMIVGSGQMPARIALELSLYKPDIIQLSECPDEALVQDLAKRLGMHYAYFPSGIKWHGAILSRFEIVRSKNCPVVGGERPDELFTRHWGQAEIRLPSDEIVVVHSAHLRSGDNTEIRQQEIKVMTQAMTPDLQSGRAMLLIGDLNHTPQQPEYAMWKLSGWLDTFAEVGKGDGATIKADTPNLRIDYVWATTPLAKRLVESRPLFEGAFRVNPADPQSVALSDHLPQLAVFKLD